MNINIPIATTPPPVLSTTCTPEQQAAIDWISNSSGHLILEAVAGSGKTFTIIEMCVAIVLNEIKAGKPPRKMIALMSFNSKVRDELRARILSRNLSQWVEVNTVHGFGFSAFKSRFGPRKPNSYKLSDIIDPILKSLKLNWSYTKAISQTVSIAKDSGMGLTFPSTSAEWKRIIEYHDISWDEEKLPLSSFINICSDVFHRSVQDTDKIDFSDMIWFPLKHELPFHQYDFVFIDEAQDTNATRREVAKRMLKQGEHPEIAEAEKLGVRLDSDLITTGRLIAVGDRHQAIYGFTGADNDSLDQLKEAFNAAELPLSVCFRCSKTVIDHARKLVQHIQPHVNAADGSVSTVEQDVFETKLFAKEFQNLNTSVILCRKNAPLVSLAFRLLNAQIPCRIEGKDIGQELIRLCKKLKPTDKASLETALRKHLNEQAQKLPPYKYDVLVDKVSAITSVLHLPNVTSLEKFYSSIEALFSDYDPKAPPKLTLSSVHKSKGLEWSTVYLLGRNAYMPSKFATQPWMEEQETNLIYVAITRAMHHLIEVTVTDD
jgi:DNA helicase-2/ATP-dependent DNA helicase PcrA